MFCRTLRSKDVLVHIAMHVVQLLLLFIGPLYVGVLETVLLGATSGANTWMNDYEPCVDRQVPLRVSNCTRLI
jgi:hypothetical protein